MKLFMRHFCDVTGIQCASMVRQSDTSSRISGQLRIWSLLPLMDICFISTCSKPSLWATYSRNTVEEDVSLVSQVVKLQHTSEVVAVRRTRSRRPGHNDGPRSRTEPTRQLTSGSHVLVPTSIHKCVERWQCTGRISRLEVYR
ncbi:hypothetical protein LshimejAT787_0411320 [Lyophyllum shimeji]|uniref:Uncharacterized protein n=1 Tax=Lyophyllum shimeji TaxID=47721 RepID=A0A9P3UP98_LYOSH|nr:hypothetical protein LshimejAT787_0411320 [Lyophyllum shimeji]